MPTHVSDIEAVTLIIGALRAQAVTVEIEVAGARDGVGGRGPEIAGAGNSVHLARDESEVAYER